MDFAKELNDTNPIADILSKYASKVGRDVITTWNDWLEWCCKVFEWKDIDKAGGIPQRFIECKNEDAIFFEAMREWLELSYREIYKRGAYDAFGTLYEANFQSAFKANSCGQFFTPMNICDVMSNIMVDGNDNCNMPTEEVVKFNDCACGSGRTLLAAWNRCNKYNRNLFFAGDLDSTSVYMCALNFMVHGMVGAVEKRDALTRDWYFGFIVNACKVPFANNFSCLQYYDNEEQYNQALYLLEKRAKDWDCIRFRPDTEILVEEVKDNIENNQWQKVQKTIKEPIELSLFD